MTVNPDSTTNPIKEEAVKGEKLLSMLLAEKLRIEAEIAEPQHRLRQVNDLLRDALLKHGREYVDEELRVVAFIEKRHRWAYDAQVLFTHFPEISSREGLLDMVVNEAAIERLMAEGVITKSELEAYGIRKVIKVIPTLLVKPLKSARLGR